MLHNSTFALGTGFWQTRSTAVGVDNELINSHLVWRLVSLLQGPSKPAQCSTHTFGPPQQSADWRFYYYQRVYHMDNTYEKEIATVSTADVVPLQPTNICDNGLAALRYFGQIHGNIVQKGTTLFRTILAFTVQIIVPKPVKTKGRQTPTVKRTALSTVTSRPHNNNINNMQTSSTWPSSSGPAPHAFASWIWRTGHREFASTLCRIQLRRRWCHLEAVDVFRLWEN